MMRRGVRLSALFGVVALASAWQARAESAPELPAPSEGVLWQEWSFTAVGEYTRIPGPEDDDDVGGWFDQYEFTPNKSSDFPFELGVRDASFDLFRDETALVQLRFASPSSQLGVSGSQLDEPFFNQRFETWTRLRGLELDFRYRRIRSEQLRLFPDTQGPGLVFDDRSRATDRFQRDRTGFRAEARLRPQQRWALGSGVEGWAPELRFRGGYDSREGRRQLRFHRDPSNDWLGDTQGLDRSVSDVGVGLLVAPRGLLTVSLDFDHERFRVDTPILTEMEFGYPLPDGSRAVAFVPETDRNTGTLRFHSRIGEGAELSGAFQLSELEQVAQFTPDQRAAGLSDNRVRHYSAETTLDARVNDWLAWNALFEFERRDNEIDRSTLLFNDANGSQVDPFVDDWQRFVVAGELVFRLPALQRAGLGLRYEMASRDLDFAQPGGLRILPVNAFLEDEGRSVTLYGRASARPWKRLRVSGELGMRWSPDTGYATELDDHVYGRVRASYTIALERPVMLSAFLRGGEGENDDFTMISGLGPFPAGTRLRRSFERSRIAAGFTASHSPLARLSLFASVFYGRDDADSHLDLSTLQRYFQDAVPIDFSRDGVSRFENEQASLVVGMHLRLDDRSDAALSYAFTHAQADYLASSASPALDLTADNRRVDSQIHVFDVELGRWVLPGLRLLVGYRYQHYDDDVPLPTSVASALAPFDRSSHRHDVTLGLTLTSEFFDAR